MNLKTSLLASLLLCSFALVPQRARAADDSITASLVVLVGTGQLLDDGGYTAAASTTIGPGQPVYIFDTTAKTLKLADADASTATATVYGIALNAATAGQPVRVLRKGTYAPGFTGAASRIVCLSATAGATCPPADVTTGLRAVVIGVMPAASQLKVDFTTTAFFSTAAVP